MLSEMLRVKPRMRFLRTKQFLEKNIQNNKSGFFLFFIDACIKTAAWEPPVTSLCPDKCPSLEEKRFTGNIVDPYNPRQYIACFLGKTIGCVTCPGKLLFNNDWNACLYEGKFKTQHISDVAYV